MTLTDRHRISLGIALLLSAAACSGGAGPVDGGAGTSAGGNSGGATGGSAGGTTGGGQGQNLAIPMTFQGLAFGTFLDGGVDPSKVHLWFADGDLQGACDGGGSPPVAPHSVQIDIYGSVTAAGQPGKPVAPGSYATMSSNAVNLVTGSANLTYSEYTIDGSGFSLAQTQYPASGSVTLTSIDAQSASGSFTATFDGSHPGYSPADGGPITGSLSESFNAGYCTTWNP
ncbi:MAG: hypothetical protein ACYCWW_05025 [Deltaproteobacteria bacterium]